MRPGVQTEGREYGTPAMRLPFVLLIGTISPIRNAAFVMLVSSLPSEYCN